MGLLDRYLQAVRFWLPKAHKEDIAAELSEDICSQIKEREAELGRDLNQAEVAAVLKQLGRPFFVANRYLPQQYLIGPTLFPIYRFVLKIVALCYLVPWVLVWIGLMSFDSGYRVQHSGHSLLGALVSLLGAFWPSALMSMGVITVVFAVIERAQTKSRFLEEWDPQRLPAVRDVNKISRASSVIDFVANAVFFLWWLPLRSFFAPLVAFFPFFAFIPGFSAIRITLAPVWVYFYWGFLLLAIANMANSGVNLFRPYWTRTRAAVRLATDALAVLLLCWESKSHILATIQAPAIAPARAVQITHTINFWISAAFPFIAALGLVLVGFDVYRTFRVSETEAQVAGSMAASH